MFAYIKGNLEIKTKGYIVIDVAGIGYKIFMSEKSIEELKEVGEMVKVHTYLKVREDDMSLYGFNTNEELRMFELLLSVSGVGAKVAIGMLSNITPSSFVLAVVTEDVDKLKKLPGIGAKTAQRIILELKDKLKTENKQNEQMQEEIIQKEEQNDRVKEAYQALQVLGYSTKEIKEALEKVEIETLSVEEIIRKGLGNLAR